MKELIKQTFSYKRQINNVEFYFKSHSLLNQG